MSYCVVMTCIRLFMMSGVRRQVQARYKASGVRCHASYGMRMAPNTRRQAPGAMHQPAGARYQRMAYVLGVRLTHF